MDEISSKEWLLAADLLCKFIDSSNDGIGSLGALCISVYVDDRIQNKKIPIPNEGMKA